MNVKSGTKNISVVLPAEVLSKIEAIAEATEHSVDWMISRALRTYLLNEGGDVLNSIEGRNQIARGEFEDIDDVIVDLERLIK
ncbi:ribbon-helix-helix protein, CopG family [Brucella pseudogrignonensis]|uniref:ribbon-helix-helix protein, CopG family n=1 Tax=Brucella pseudogrignonensis TaxID=419475 RepID=UPI00124D06DB|nr:ribbon-helix-helix protein, CopG family [Brucella pseudogrignonensis]KAB2689370.1 ribbon-helix-helix protein, CopG family [Brucella pseudogrignonensis]